MSASVSPGKIIVAPRRPGVSTSGLSKFTGAFLTDGALKPRRHYRSWPLRFSNLRADATNNWDLSAIKKLNITERVTLQFRGEFLNAFNHPRFKAPNMDPYSRAFGQVSGTSAYPRQIQAGAKVIF